jgi:clumping factor A
MIVVSVLLILVAVTLLVLGLAGGSSTLLISSIVASLLAAVALVIGARQAAAMRRSVIGDPVGDPASLPIDLDAGEPAGVSSGARSGFAAATTASAMSAASGRRGGRRRDQEPVPSFADGPSAADEGLQNPPEAAPRAANRDDAESALAADAAYREADPAYGGDPAYDPAFAPGDGVHAQGDPAYGAERDRSVGYPDDEPVYDDAALFDDFRAAHGGVAPPPEADAGGDPDYGRASSFIGGARSEDPAANSWRRAHADESLGPDAEAGGFAPAGAGLAGEFGEPDVDDPDDEPLPQAVRPADAVQVARMNDEVMVVDGRPRYHMSDCPHLADRQTESLPAAEAVELGFSPCGQCRPVDRLVARAARH